MFCPYCGTLCAEYHKYCYRCGKELPEPDADEVIPETAVSDDILSDLEPISPEPISPEPIPPEPEEVPSVLPEIEAAAAEPLPAPPATEPAEPVPQPKKGRLWPPILALCLMMCAGLAAFFLMPGASNAARSCFTIEGGVLYFDYSLYTGPETLTVPETVDGVAVTGISQGCFADCDGLTTIILPQTVTTIGDNAFAGCDSLRGIFIPQGVLSIGSGALAQCPVLEAVYFPDSLMEIGDGCLDGCDSLRYILFDGTYAQWRDLYQGIFKSRVELHTDDGVYRAMP